MAKSLLISTIVCGTISVIIRTVSIYTMVKVTRNFGKGLKEKGKKASSVRSNVFNCKLSLIF